MPEYPDDIIRAVAERALEQWDLGAARLELISRSEKNLSGCFSVNSHLRCAATTLQPNRCLYCRSGTASRNGSRPRSFSIGKFVLSMPEPNATP